MGPTRPTPYSWTSSGPERFRRPTGQAAAPAQPRTPADLAALAAQLLAAGGQQLAAAQQLLALLAAQQLPAGQAAPAVAVDLPAAAGVFDRAAVKQSRRRQASRMTYFTLGTNSATIAKADPQRFLLHFCAAGLSSSASVSFDPITSAGQQGINVGNAPGLVIDEGKYGDIVGREWYGATTNAGQILAVMEGFFL